MLRYYDSWFRFHPRDYTTSLPRSTLIFLRKKAGKSLREEVLGPPKLLNPQICKDNYSCIELWVW